MYMYLLWVLEKDAKASVIVCFDCRFKSLRNLMGVMASERDSTGMDGMFVYVVFDFVRDFYQLGWNSSGGF